MSLMMIFSPFTMSAVARVSCAVSSWPSACGTGDFRSPFTSWFIRVQQACIGVLMLPESFTATTTEARLEATTTRILMRMPIYVSVR